jgi:hypothetical protein
MSGSNVLRVVQASPSDPMRAIEAAWLNDCQAIAWDLRHNCSRAVDAARGARLRSEGWYSVEQEAAMQQDLDLIRVPSGVFEPTSETGRTATDFLIEAILRNEWCTKLWLTDIQGPSVVSAHERLAAENTDEPTSALPDRFPTELFFEGLLNELWKLNRPIQISPILRPGPIRVPFRDAFNRSSVNAGVCCGACDDGPELLERFRKWAGSLFVPQIGILLGCEELGCMRQEHDASGSWQLLAHEHYGRDLIPCIQADDAERFESCLILLGGLKDLGNSCSRRVEALETQALRR